MKRLLFILLSCSLAASTTMAGTPAVDCFKKGYGNLKYLNGDTLSAKYVVALCAGTIDADATLQCFTDNYGKLTYQDGSPLEAKMMVILCSANGGLNLN